MESMNTIARETAFNTNCLRAFYGVLALFMLAYGTMLHQVSHPHASAVLPAMSAQLR